MIHELYQHFINSAGITTDSRSVSENMIFFALRGDKFNGNEFALKALEDGAAFSVIDDRKFATDERCILVENVYSALADLAKYHRSQLKCPVFAITGSNGKTTTKELIVSVLSVKYKLAYTHGNLNNHIGVPLTILSADQKTEFLVVEMGANHPGEIAFLCDIAQPDYGLITNVGKAHLEGFGSLQSVFETKTELYNYIITSGKGIFVNGDDPELSEAASTHTIVTYGKSSGMILGSVRTNVPLLQMEWQFNGRFYDQPTQLFGAYNIYNVLAAVSVGLFFKIKPERIVESISAYQPQNNRSQYIETEKNNKIILDAYNANPSSMNPAIEEFLQLEGKPKCVILGSMMELGVHSKEEHESVLLRLSQADLDEVMLVGEEFLEFITEFPKFSFFRSCDELSDRLRKQPVTDTSILIKGSRVNTLEKIISDL